MTRIYSLDYGGFFYGTLEQFQDCFLGEQVSDEIVMDFAERHEAVYHIFDGELIDFTGLTPAASQDVVNRQIADSADKNMVTNKKAPTPKTNLFPAMEDALDTHELIDMLRRALPYLQGYDLMGTGGGVSKDEYDELNNLEKEIAVVIEEDPDEHGCHGPNG